MITIFLRKSHHRLLLQSQAPNRTRMMPVNVCSLDDVDLKALNVTEYDGRSM